MRRFAILATLGIACVLGAAWALTTVATAPWVVESTQASSSFGLAASSAGDVNGDGFSDVIVGALLYDNGHTDEGRAYAYHGSSGGLFTTAAWTVESNQTSANFGNGVSSAGDVNRDGFTDVLVTARGYDNGTLDEGRISVYHGGASGLSTTAAWVVESNQISAAITNFSARSVAVGVGDVNGDGFSDVAVGYASYDNGQTDEGRVYVYHGAAGGLSTTAAWASESGQASASFGISIAGMMDVNGDGFSDLAIGALGFDNGETDEGRAYVFSGASGGLSTTAAWITEVDQSSCQYSFFMSGAGDVTRDGFSDLLVLASAFGNGEANEGRAYVFHGSASGLSTTAAWIVESDQVGAAVALGTVRSAVSGAGDVNGDGFSDVLVGYVVYDNGETNEGRSYLYHGHSSGLSTTPGWVAEGEQASGRFSQMLASAGDVNADGMSDVLVSAPAYDNGETDEGRVYVFHGDGIRPQGRGDPAKASGNELELIFRGCFLGVARRR